MRVAAFEKAKALRRPYYSAAGLLDVPDSGHAVQHDGFVENRHCRPVFTQKNVTIAYFLNSEIGHGARQFFETVSFKFSW